MRRYRELLRCVCLWTACCAPSQDTAMMLSQEEVRPFTLPWCTLFYCLWKEVSQSQKEDPLWRGRGPFLSSPSFKIVRWLREELPRSSSWGRKGGGTWGNACLVLCVLATRMEAVSSPAPETDSVVPQMISFVLMFWLFNQDSRKKMFWVKIQIDGHYRFCLCLYLCKYLF